AVALTSSVILSAQLVEDFLGCEDSAPATFAFAEDPVFHPCVDRCPCGWVAHTEDRLRHPRRNQWVLEERVDEREGIGRSACVLESLTVLRLKRQKTIG